MAIAFAWSARKVQRHRRLRPRPPKTNITWTAYPKEPPAMSLVEIADLTKRYHKGGETITPLNDVSLDIEEGDFVSLMGASGSGKSTLLNLVAGIDHPDSGSIVVNGTDVTKLSRTKLAHWRAANIGYIFQTHNLIPVLTAYENVELPLLL